MWFIVIETPYQIIDLLLQVPPVACERWEVQWANTGRVVECDVIASAHRHMRLVVQPVSQGPTSFAVFSSPANERGLTFSSGYLSPF